MELNTPLNVQICRRKLPDGAVQFLYRKASASHGAQEVYPRDFARGSALAWCEEQGIEDLKHGLIDLELRLLVVLLTRSLDGTLLTLNFGSNPLGFDLFFRPNRKLVVLCVRPWLRVFWGRIESRLLDWFYPRRRPLDLLPSMPRFMIPHAIIDVLFRCPLPVCDKPSPEQVKILLGGDHLVSSLFGSFLVDWIIELAIARHSHLSDALEH